MDLHNTIFTLAEVIEALVGYFGKYYYCDHANRLESHVLLHTSQCYITPIYHVHACVIVLWLVSPANCQF
jgi:hypothetical protein